MDCIRILLPTDFSVNALNAIKYALDLYSKQKCEFYLLHTYEVDGYALSGATKVVKPKQFLYETAKKEAEALFRKLMKVVQLHSYNYDHSFHSIITYDTLINATKDIITKNNIDIVVMGTKGITGSRLVVYGTNTISLMEHISECPILAIPENQKFILPREIVFPTDYTISHKPVELRHLISIAKMHHAIIQVLHIVTKSEKLHKTQQANKALLTTLFKDIEFSFHELAGSSIHEEINAFIDGRDTNMIAFINPKHNFFSMMFSRPLVKELGYYSRIPLLALKIKN
ncbi:universal stress protein [Arenibacter certesii]|uniref:Universal stress protein UspA n=1 Tax=Arenibacter certesii TaxID=228955 RepID=A0A918MMP4_9FLAO|nr:universal stress protein [Arenibacter certesii]GGW41367.1 universal stress protein UspA [Arenibacter certesii]